MDTRLLKGKTVAREIYVKLKKLIEETGIKPTLDVILVGDDPASISYVRSKSKAAEKIGIIERTIRINSNITEEGLIGRIQDLIVKDNPDGILVQLPLPDHIEEEKIMQIIPADRDVDGFHPYNLGCLLRGISAPYPCTPAGIMELLKFYNINVRGRRVVVIGRSLIVGKPLAIMMMKKNVDATVTVCHSRTKNINEITKQADILIAALGKPKFIKREMVRENCIVIDVGVNSIDDPHSKKGYRLVGDCDFDNLIGYVDAITPVPGGVGPLTVALLMHNTVRATLLRSNLNIKLDI